MKRLTCGCRSTHASTLVPCLRFCYPRICLSSILSHTASFSFLKCVSSSPRSIIRTPSSRRSNLSIFRTSAIFASIRDQPHLHRGSDEATYDMLLPYGLPKHISLPSLLRPSSTSSCVSHRPPEHSMSSKVCLPVDHCRRPSGVDSAARGVHLSATIAEEG